MSAFDHERAVQRQQAEALARERGRTLADPAVIRHLPDSGAPPRLHLVGWIVLTRQLDGSWQPDWDGEIHIAKENALIELENARDIEGGGEFVWLCEVVGDDIIP